MKMPARKIWGCRIVALKRPAGLPEGKPPPNPYREFLFWSIFALVALLMAANLWSVLNGSGWSF